MSGGIVINGIVLSAFAQGYIECALWAGGEDGNMDEVTFVDLPRATMETLVKDADDFLAANHDALVEACEQGRPMSHLGHDFWLTRNGHGAGFWDRGLGKLGDDLTAASKPYGSCDLYFGDDGLVYAQ